MDANILSILLAIIAVTPGLVALIRGWQRDRAETDKLDIDASASAASALKTYSEEIRRLRDEISELQAKYNNRIEGMQAQITQMQIELSESKATLDEWSQGINRLLAQLISMDTQPVWKPKTGPLKLRGSD